MRPFSNGTEYMGWKYRNCNKCQKGYIDGMGFTCGMEEKIDMALVTDGQINQSIAERSGLDEDSPSCKEFEVESGCPDCKGEGFLYAGGALKVCVGCGGSGRK